MNAIYIFRGFYPKGRGEVLLAVKPIPDGYLKPVNIDTFGDHPAIRGIMFISGPKHQTKKHQVLINIVLCYD